MSEAQTRFFSKPLLSDIPLLWLWVVGVGRAGVLFIVIIGSFLYRVTYLYYVFPFFVLAFFLSFWHLLVLYRGGRWLGLSLWVQILTDFFVVGCVITITDGFESSYTFLLVLVIMEAGFLLGLYQGLLFSIFAVFFMAFQFYLDKTWSALSLIDLYPLIVQSVAFIFTGFLSGYWHQRLSILKEFQENILDNMNSGFLVTDGWGIVRSINKAGCKIFGVDRDNVVGKPVDQLIKPSSGFECPVLTALRTNRDFSSYEFYVQTPDGNQKLIGLTTNRFYNSKGKLSALIVSCTDLSELDKIRQDLRRHDRLVAIGEQLSSLAHEIRNPIASIRGAVAELRKNADHPEVMDQLIDVAIRECDRLNYIVTSFLNFAREPVRGKDIIRVSELLNEFVERFRHDLPKNGHHEVRLVVHEGAEECAIRGDAEQMMLLFQNLSQNAIEAMPNGGVLTITLRRVPETSTVEILFSDEGIGISPDKIPRIFQPFYTEKKKGIGMGLPVCLRIISAHDGNIHVASNPGKGTTMIVQFPLMREEVIS